MSKKLKKTIESLANLDKAVRRTAYAFRKLAWAFIRAKYHFDRDFSDN